ncbi:hypothetical protein ACERK3_05825 [Phycisphaerales bacterium AB-hyl4]|uniref:Uncharacterized protein n=1 Tax=Natronomicrosphaera hydrolytica TaxID=3242702 RepID=A0ABV4U2J8_9BACT
MFLKRIVAQAHPRPVLSAALLAVGLLLAGCSTSTFVDDERAQNLATLAYPDQAEHADDLDILVQRRGGRIQIINRSPEVLEDMQLWVNRQYVREISRIDIGVDNSFSLRHFINRYQEAFPTAGLLSPDRTEPVTSAELYDPETSQRYRLTVMPPRRDQLGQR